MPYNTIKHLYLLLHKQIETCLRTLKLCRHDWSKISLNSTSSKCLNTDNTFFYTLCRGLEQKLRKRSQKINNIITKHFLPIATVNAPKRINDQLSERKHLWFKIILRGLLGDSEVCCNSRGKNTNYFLTKIYFLNIFQYKWGFRMFVTIYGSKSIIDYICWYSMVFNNTIYLEN